jgi:amino acid transporter
LIGPYLGFFVGYFEIIGNAAIIGALTLVFGESIVTTLSIPSYYQIFFYPLPYLFAAYLQCKGVKFFGKVMVFIVLYCLLIFAIFIFGSLAHINLQQYNQPLLPTYNKQTIHDYFHYANYGGFFFMGIESLPVISSEAHNVRIVT